MSGYRGRIIVSITVFLFSIIISLALYGIVSDRRILRSELVEDGNFLVSNLAVNSETGMFGEGGFLLRTSVDAIFKDKNVVWAVVYNSYGREIFKKSLKSIKVPAFKTSIKDLDDKILQRRIPQDSGPEIIDFFAPVYLRNNIDLGFVGEGSDSYAFPDEQEIIGIARVGISLEALNQRTLEVLIATSFITAVYLLIAFFLVIFIEKSISRPLRKLSNGVDEIGKGNLNMMIEVVADDEIGELAKSFNKMTADLKLSEQERSRLASAVEQAEETVVIMGVDGTIQYVNPAVERTLDVKRDEIIGKKGFSIDREIIIDDGEVNNIYDIQKTLKKGNAWSGRNKYTRKDRTTRMLDETISPIRDEAGMIANYIAIGKDVTTELRLEKELRQAQKMESIGTLAGGISHDFNNILSAIFGYTELSLNISDNPKTKEHLEHVLKAAGRARDLVKQILAFSRQTEQEKKPVKIGPIINEVLKFLQASLPSNIVIQQNQLTDSDIVFSDPVQIHQVLMNLCTNAGYAMRKKGGILKVSMSSVHLNAGEASGHMDLRPGWFLKIEVCDTGEGIERDIIERIFEPYFTTKSKAEGTGLGLSVVHGIIKEHEGAITVYSEKGSGTTFCLFLPSVEKNKEEKKVPAVRQLLQGTERILFVDDEKELVDLGSGMLENFGYEVETRTSPVEALQLFSRMSDKYDLVITDKTMPNMSGFELAMELIKIRPDIPVILCTGFSDEVDLNKCNAVGIKKLLMKPLVMQELAESVRKVLGEAAKKEIQ